MKQHNNLLLTSFETQKILHGQPPATDSVKEKQSILKKRICKSEDNVIAGLKIAQEIFPFNILGLDTDNGTEFINYAAAPAVIL